MKFLRDFNFNNKRVLVRADFNVPLLDSKKIASDFRIKAVLPTINYLLNHQAKIILSTHFGRPNGKVMEDLRVDLIAKKISELLNHPVKKLNDCIGSEVERVIEKMEIGEVVLLENIQFYPGEKEKDSNYIKSLATLADFFVLDAFGQVHRDYASISGLPEYLPSCAGLLLEKEIKNLSKILNDSEPPSLAIIGGVKISTKIKVIENFLNRGDDVILGGALANTVLKAQGFAIGKSLSEERMIGEVKKMELTNPKLHLPVDAVVSVSILKEEVNRIDAIGGTKEDEMILDVGPDSVDLFKDVISHAHTIIWNGPMGYFEIKNFSSGSIEIAKAVTENPCFSVVGGGDTIALLDQLNLLDKIDHVSTGGGAMLKFLAKEKLPGIEALS